ncbi:MAG: hypothetical protein AAFV93_21955 [Chloroflexota bacterium]
MSTRDMLIGLGLSLLIGLIGALPVAMVALLFGGAEVARDIYTLQAILLGGWLPLKFLVDAQIKGQSSFRLPKISLNQLSLFILMFGLGIIIFVMYFTTATAFLLGALTYSFTAGNLLIALLVGLIIQITYMVRGSMRERDLGVNNAVFVRMQDFGNSNFDIRIDPEQVRRQTPREQVAPLLNTPEDNLRDRSYDDTTSDQAPMTINIDPNTVSEQSDDNA